MLLTGTSAFGQAESDWQPVGPSEWVQTNGTLPGLRHRSLGGAGLVNYEDSRTGWRKIDNRLVITPDSVYCHTGPLKITITADGTTRVFLLDGDTVRSVTRSLIGLGWINTATGEHSWIDNRLTFSAPTIDSNRIVWSAVSPGVSYVITKQRAGVRHGIRFSAPFLDSLAALSALRSDTSGLRLANLFRFSFENMPLGDSALGDVATRLLSKIARSRYTLSRQQLYFDGWDDTTLTGERITPDIPVRQYWRRVNGELYCLEWIPVNALNQVHAAYPGQPVWHNLADTLTSDSAEFKDNWLCEWETTTNFGHHNELWLGYHTSYGGYGNGFLWWDMPVDNDYRLVACSLSVVVNYDGAVDDTLLLLPCDTTLSGGYGVGNAWLYTGDGVATPANQEQSWDHWYEWFGVPATNDTSWTTAGGDWLNDTLAVIPISATSGATRHTVALDSNYIAALMSGRRNSGFFLINKNRNSTEDNRKVIWSTEASVEANRPAVELYYTTPTQQYLWANAVYDVDSTGAHGSYELIGTSSWAAAITGPNLNSYVQNQYDANLYHHGDSMRIIYDISDCDMDQIDSVIMYTVAQRAAFGDSLGNLFRAGLIIGTDTAFGSTWSNTTVTTMRDKLTRPGGGTWTESDLDNARFLFETVGNWSVGVESNLLDQMYIIVYGLRDVPIAVVNHRREHLLKGGRR